MISGKLISIIEKNADTIIQSLVKELRTNSRTTAYKNLADSKLIERTKNVYSHLSSWLGDKTDAEIGKLYNALGKERLKENIPLSQLISALIITRNHLCRYIGNEMPCNSSLEIYQLMEFTNYITTFFDKAIYHSVRGTEDNK